jgi:DNA-binding PadR family transcriptional regulator
MTVSTTANSFDPRQAIEGLIGYAKDKATGAVKGQFKAKPDSEKTEIAILAALESGAKTAAQIVKQIQLTSGGTWAPGDGETSQALSKLSASNHVSATTEADRKVYALTQEGTDALSKAREKPAAEPQKQSFNMATNFNWMSCDASFLRSASKLPPVLADVAQTGSREQQMRAAEILDKARHDLHLILAEK